MTETERRIIIKAGPVNAYPDYESFEADLGRYRDELAEAGGMSAAEMHHMGPEKMTEYLGQLGVNLVDYRDEN